MKNINLLYILCCISLIQVLKLNAQTPTELFDQTLAEIYENDHIPGFAVTVLSKEAILYQNSFGYADLENKIPYTPQTLHNIGSISKTLIGVSLMQLEAAGKISMDTKVNDILPFKVVNPHHPEVAITLEHLATHTSTIFDRKKVYDLGAYISDDATKEKRKKLSKMNQLYFKRMLENEKLSMPDYLEAVLSKEGKWFHPKNFKAAKPGQIENYSNIGAALAAYIIEIVTGEEYGEYVKNNILKPLKMNASGWTLAEIDQTKFAKRYIKKQAIPNYTLITYPDGGLISSNAELSTYLMEMIKGYYGESRFLSPTTFQNMLSDHLEGAGLENPHWGGAMKSGLFWEYIKTNGVDNIGHSGSDPGILTMLFFDPNNGIGYVITFNSEGDKKSNADIIKIWDLVSQQKGLFKETINKNNITKK